MEKILGFLAPTIIAFIIFILNAILPGRWVAGYITRPDSNEKMRYHLNGIFVFIVPLFAWFVLGYLKIMPFGFIPAAGMDWQAHAFSVSFLALRLYYHTLR
jgi:hypothetical protein